MLYTVLWVVWSSGLSWGYLEEFLFFSFFAYAYSMSYPELSFFFPFFPDLSLHHFSLYKQRLNVPSA